MNKSELQELIDEQTAYLRHSLDKLDLLREAAATMGLAATEGRLHIHDDEVRRIIRELRAIPEKLEEA